VVTGCYAQLRPDEIKELGVDRVVSNLDKDKLPGVVCELFDIAPEGGAGLAVEFDSVISGIDGMTRGLVKIQDGCDEQCAFCTIWLARGPVWSRHPNTVIREIKKLSDAGFKEVVLTGVHIGKYESVGLGLVELTKRILNETSVARVRLSSLNPREISESLLSLMGSEPRLCPHAHLSVQSGDDAILKSMGRKYDRNDIINAVSDLTAINTKMTIGADIIVGFPGETEANFENTLNLVGGCQLQYLHVFPYSDRPGTKSSRMGGKILHEVKEQRAGRLRRIGKDKKATHLRKFIGKELSVLVERRKIRRDGILTGLAENYLRVEFKGDPSLRGTIVQVVPDGAVDGKLTMGVNIGTVESKKRLTGDGNRDIIGRPVGNGSS
jgi:threonylcarbamoyladenosine tRNA methylthiotransferase MtaB